MSIKLNDLYYGELVRMDENKGSIEMTYIGEALGYKNEEGKIFDLLSCNEYQYIERDETEHLIVENTKKRELYVKDLKKASNSLLYRINLNHKIKNIDITKATKRMYELGYVPLNDKEASDLLSKVLIKK